MRWLNCLVWGLVLVFAVLFLREPLYNSSSEPDQRIPRWTLLEGLAVPGEQNLVGGLIHRLSDWEGLQARLTVLGLAAILLAAACVWGDGLFRFILPNQLGRVHSIAFRVAVALALGLSLTSLATLALGLTGSLNPRTATAWLALAPAAWLGAVWATRRKIPAESPVKPTIGAYEKAGTSLAWGLLAGSPFMILATLAAGLPTTDYDALAYHLLVPKEYWLAGAIHPVPHNVYATFPFHTEMLTLFSMTWVDSWQQGALLGQVILAQFAWLGAIGVGVTAHLLFGRPAAGFASFMYLSCPWIYRLAAIPYVEGAMLAYFSLGMAIVIAYPGCRRGAWLAGLLGGSAAACKYPALGQVAAILGTLILASAAGFGPVSTSSKKPVRVAETVDLSANPLFRDLVGLGLAFALGVLLILGPWLVRNACWTGNPVAPLADHILGTGPRSPENATRFAQAHRSTDFSLTQLDREWRIVAWKSDWQSGAIVAFALLGLLAQPHRAVAWLSGIVLLEFILFWAFTHRLDRFWLPILPPLTILAAAGLLFATATRRSGFLALLVLAVLTAFHFAYCSTGLCAIPHFTTHPEIQRQRNLVWMPAVRWANTLGSQPTGQRVLFIGQAGVFESIPPALYNTVFDESRWWEFDRETAAATRQSFESAGVTLVIVDWDWIGRYRSPGNYGYDPRIQPELFDRWVAEGVLMPVGREGPPGSPTLMVYRVIPRDADP